MKNILIGFEIFGIDLINFLYPIYWQIYLFIIQSL
jgi:hypothetical protein